MTTRPLAERLRRIWEETEPTDWAHLYDEMRRYLEDASVVAHRLGPGTPAPTFALPNVEGRLRRPSDLSGPGGLLLLFVRGHYCPMCSAQLQAYAELAPAFKASGIGIAAITPEVGGRAQRMKEDLGLDFDVLVDVDHGLALAFGLVFLAPSKMVEALRTEGLDLALRYGAPSDLMPLPSVFFVGPRGTILGAYGRADLFRRDEPSDVLAAARTALAVEQADTDGVISR